jgi:hypothetical protein
LAGRLHAALSVAGLEPSALTSLTPQSQAVLDGRVTAANPVSLIRERVGVRLEGPTLPQLGAFLSQWRRSEPCWTISSVDVSPTPIPTSADRSARVEPGGDLPLRVTVNLESLTTSENRGASR